MDGVIENWTVDELSRGLVVHLSLELIKTLTDQKINGSYFLKLTDSTLKLFNFSIVDIIDITTLISDIKSGKKMLSPIVTNDSSDKGKETVFSDSSDLSDTEKENQDPVESSGKEDQGEVIMRQFLKPSYINSLSPYELVPLRSQCLNWQRLLDLGLPGPSRPRISGVPSSAFIAQETDVEKEPPKKKTRTQQEGTRKSGRLMKSVDVVFVPSETASDDEESDEDINTSAAHNDPSMRYKLPSSLSFQSAEKLSALQPHLPAFDVEKILLETESTKLFVPALKDGFLFVSKFRKLLLRTVMRYLCYKYVDHPNKVTMSMKQGLSKSFVVAFPQFQKVVSVPAKSPWSHLLGNFQNIFKRMLTKLPDSERPRKGKGKRKSKKTVPVKDCSVDVELLACVNADRAHKDEILDGMRASFSIRVAERMNGSSITELIERYPHFKSYCGEVLALEFQLMHPKAVDMCKFFMPLVEKILKNFTDPRINTSSNIDGLKAFLLAASKLPRVVRRNIPPLPVEEEIILTLQVGTDIEATVQKRRQDAKKAVQPYLIAVKGTVTKEILKYFLVLDSNVMELGRIPFIRAADWLFKSFWVFNVYYPTSWQGFFKFMQTCVYQIFHEPCEDVPPTAEALYTQLISL